MFSVKSRIVGMGVLKAATGAKKKFAFYLTMPFSDGRIEVVHYGLLAPHAMRFDAA